MKVQYINDEIPRSDDRRGKPTGVTLFKEYTVVEKKDDKYSILNDDNKICRYSKTRFVTTDNQSIPPIRESFNSLTAPMRAEIKRLRKIIEDQNKTIENGSDV
jgi:hypothetical protein